LKNEVRQLESRRCWCWGLAYKRDIDDVRESPSLELIEKLQALGAVVDYNDPHCPKTHKMREYDLQMESKELTGPMLGDI